MNREELYDILYALAAKDGREAALFGNCRQAAREAFARSLVGDAFPELWFEIPLAGKPWLDFHSLTSYETVADTQARYAGHDEAYGQALSWFAAQQPETVRQLSLSYDTSTGNVLKPAVQLLMYDFIPDVSLAFLDAAGRADLRCAYSGFVKSMPPEWYPCYIGVFPQRSADRAWVRLECITGSSYQQEYARDAATIRKHLSLVGLEDIGDDMIAGIQELARSPFPLELQFDVGQDGAALPTVSASVRFQATDWQSGEKLNAIGRLAGWMQARGLADNRCALLAHMAFAKRATHGSESAMLSCFPAFVKLRYRNGKALDAKSYLMLQAFIDEPCHA